MQGLRAVAVGLVVIYHLYPDALTGGFVGVDVFFVISGFLITSHLVRELQQHGRVDVLGFWARRARRLMPAAVLVLLVTWVASVFLLPASRLDAAARQVAASAVYVQNWLLAGDSVDYLTAEDAPSPVQHYWSLSVEEQFYVGWPLLFVLAAWLCRGRVRSWRTAVLVLGGGVALASLAFSVVLTAGGSGAAYFVTHTRVWELAAGGLLAVVLATRRSSLGLAGRSVQWSGLVLIAGSAFWYDSGTAFPGAAALVPVGGALLVLAGGGGEQHVGLLASRPATWVGDHSYALYLWHWPLIVLWESHSGGDIGVLDGPALLVVGLALSWLTKRLVEDPVRRSRSLAPRGRGLALTLAAVIPVAVVAPQVLASDGPPPVVVLDAAHPGAAAPGGDAEPVADSVATMLPAADDAVADRPGYYSQGCEVGIGTPGTTRCEFGVPDGAVTVALVGDSKTGQWLPAFEALAEERGWRIVTYLRSRCAWTATATTVGVDDESAYTDCAVWGRDVLDRLLQDPPDLLVTTDRAVVGTVDHPEVDEVSHRQIGLGMTTYWEEVMAEGTRVVAIRETPEMGVNVPDCLSTRGAALADCTADRDEALPEQTPTVVATEAMDGQVPLVDLTGLLCPGDGSCPPVLGNVLVYRDAHHLTRTYTVSLAPYLERQLVAAGVVEQTR
ncbi:acyltransferase family protein [Blastococcus aurantiacus]|uniref:acyltransferase family protein n=1 Tax=Blastococcus aurantiacus TaxID=1550231 RepID=UPI000B8128C1|nr:acyltransferase family protein [Blastococcus aurantiacus]